MLFAQHRALTSRICSKLEHGTSSSRDWLWLSRDEFEHLQKFYSILADLEEKVAFFRRVRPFSLLRNGRVEERSPLSPMLLRSRRFYQWDYQDL